VDGRAQVAAAEVLGVEKAHGVGFVCFFFFLVGGRALFFFGVFSFGLGGRGRVFVCRSVFFSKNRSVLSKRSWTASLGDGQVVTKVASALWAVCLEVGAAEEIPDRWGEVVFYVPSKVFGACRPGLEIATPSRCFLLLFDSTEKGCWHSRLGDLDYRVTCRIQTGRMTSSGWLCASGRAVATRDCVAGNVGRPSICEDS
jgi:hypothetical protein